MSSTRAMVLLAATLATGVAIYLGLRGIGQRVTTPRPDLEFAGFVRASPMFPEVGQEARLHAVIRNVGEGDFEGEFEVVAYQSDPRKNANQAHLGSGSFAGRIAVGQSTTVGIPFTAPQKPATLELFFEIDVSGGQREISVENNVVMSEITVVTPPEAIADLEISELRLDPAAPVVGRTVAIVAVVRNRGGAPMQASAVVDLYVNDPIGPKPMLPGTHRLTVPPLGPGESAEVQARTHFDEAQLIGIYAQVDTDDAIPESDSTNNVEGPLIVAVGSFEQSGEPDLVVESIELDPPTPLAGRTALLRIRVANRGRADTTSQFSVNVNYGPTGGRGPGFPPEDDSEPRWSRDLRFLAAGQSYELPPIRVVFQRVGNWSAKAEIDPYEEVPEGELEDNNAKQLLANVAQPR